MEHLGLGIVYLIFFGGQSAVLVWMLYKDWRGK